ncbi:MAG: Stk1 family PASTA domain-containing Ser/Thr kinase [Defluviitaleaceae bacterium]|nr:Stk1 family PASTA domain-containing Ser/Thr kinase [Defluviitaleaceae bacterium]
MLLKAGIIIAERYKIIEKIGIGGMAIVYRATDLKLNRNITFKVLKEEHLVDDFVFSKFNTEAKAAASLNSQNIVNVYDVGVEDNIHYIVMEFIDGITLKQLINSRSPFENEEAIGVAIQIAQALKHAHESNVIHQDIKPQNILITNEGIVKVTDFGIAKAQVSSSTTTTSTPMGSVHYFSPEQARGRYVDHRSDIYSLGIILFEMVTGELPFDGDTSVAIALKHINEPIPELPDEVSESLRAIIIKATHKLSNKRYNTIEEMLEDLKLAITYKIKPNEDEHFDLSPTIKIDEKEYEIIEKESEIAATSSEYSQSFSIEKKEENNYPKYRFFNQNKKSILKLNEKKIIIFAIATALILIGFIVTITFRELFSNNINGDSYTEEIPNFVGDNIDYAISFLAEKDIEIEIEQVYSNEEYGTILYQDIDNITNITSVDQIENIFFRVSRGEFSFTLPNLIGRSLNEVQGMLIDIEQIELRHTVIQNDIIPIGIVIDQFPDLGVEIGEGSVVYVEVSGGAGITNVTVPNLVGLSVTAANTTLAGLNLLPNINSVHNENVAVNTVISHSPSANASVPLGTSISIVVSMGPAEQEISTEIIPSEPDTNDLPVETNTNIETVAEELQENNNIVDNDTTLGTEIDTETIPTQPILNIVNVSFSLPGDFNIENDPLLHVTILNENDVVFENQVSASSFPFSLDLQGIGSRTVRLFIQGSLVSYSIVNFDNQ